MADIGFTQVSYSLLTKKGVLASEEFRESNNGTPTINTGAANRLAYYATAGQALSNLSAITPSRVLLSDANGLPIAANTATYPSLAEFAYVKGVTSAIQTQLDGKSLQVVMTTGAWTKVPMVLKNTAETKQVEISVNSDGHILLNAGTNQNFHFSGDVVAFSALTPPPGSWWDSMPYASASVVGGIKVGANLSIDGNGVLSASGSGMGGSGTTNYIVKFTAATTIGNSIIFDNGTNVGIGTTSPGYKLDVNGEAGFVTRIRINTGSQSNQIFGDGNAFSIGGSNNLGIRNDAGSIVLASNGSTPQFILTTAGNVGIGTNDPSAKLHVGGDGLFGIADNSRWLFDDNGGSGYRFGIIKKAGSYTKLVYGSGADFSIAQSSVADLSATAVTGQTLTDVFFISNSRKIGIGTTNPQGRLTVSNAGAAGIEMDGTGGVNGPYIQSYNRSTVAYSPLDVYASQIQFFISNTEKMRIASDGTVGIGLNGGNPQANLEVIGAGPTIIARQTSTTSYAGVRVYNDVNSSTRSLEIDYSGSAYASSLLTGGVTGEAAAVTTTGNYPLMLGTNNNARVIITGGGNVGVGVNPTYKFEVSGSAKISTALAVGNIAPSATAGRIDAENDVVAFSTSDIRLKKNINVITDPVQKLLQIRGVNFDWIINTEIHGFSGPDVGVIAHEVEVVMPEIVITRKNGYQAVKYEKLVPLLIESIKEQQKEIDELNYKLNQLKL